MKKFIVTLATVVSASLVPITGCSTRDDEAYEQLLRHEKSRDAADLSCGMTFEDRLACVENQLQTNNHVAAERLLRPLLIDNSDHVKVIMLAARVHSQAGRHEDAITLLKQSVKVLQSQPGRIGNRDSIKRLLIAILELGKRQLNQHLHAARDPSFPDQHLQLTDVAEKVGLRFRYDNGDDSRDEGTLIHQLTGGGIGVIDFDLDGYSDLYFTQGAGDAFEANGRKPNCLFRNLSGRTWQAISQIAGTDHRGYGQGVAVADVNQDGFPDLIVANVGPNLLMINNGDGTFQRNELPAMSSKGEWTTSIASGDLNGDHLPDIFAVNYIDDPKAITIRCEKGSSNCSPRHYQPAADRLWQSDKQGRFHPCAEQKRLAKRSAFGFGILVANLDGRAGNDVFVANDTVDNHLWISRSDHGPKQYRLVEASRLHGCGRGTNGLPRGCMGVAHGDFDRNQLLDLYVTNFANEPSDMFLQAVGGLFVAASEARAAYHHSKPMVGWGTQAIDLDRNGWLDLVVLNGHVIDRTDSGEAFKMNPQLFRGHHRGLELITARDLGDRFWSTPTLGRTLAVLDWNRDGKPDLVANHLDAPVSLLQNESVVCRAGGHYLQLQLVGRQCERDATGATVTLVSADQSWTHCNAGGDGFLCSNESIMDFGIHTAKHVDEIRIRWPNGSLQVHHELAADRRYLIVEGQAEAFELP